MIAKPIFWVIGAGLLQVPMIQAARQLGMQVLTTDAAHDAPGFAVADYPYCGISTYDVQGHLQLLDAELDPLRHRIVGVATCGADVAPTVATVAWEAQLPGIPYDVACRTHNKYLVRHKLHEAGLMQYQPLWVEATSLLEANKLADGFDSFVVKPVCERASRGVTLVDDPTELRQESAIVKAFTHGNTILIEQRLYGTEHSVEGIFDRHGQLVFFNIVDRLFNYESGVPIETGHVNPSSLSPEAYAAICNLFLATAKALGVTWGPFKIDLMMTEDGPKILECTARLSGGYDCQRTTPLATGRNPIAAVVQLASGQPITPSYVTSQWQRYAACAAITLSSGRFQGFALEHFQHLPFTVAQLDSPYQAIMDADAILTIRSGAVLTLPEHNGQRHGFAFATGHTWMEAWSKAVQKADEVALSCIVEPL